MPLSLREGGRGNIAHGAEVCVSIVPAEDYDQTARFRAVLKQSCSYWNDGFGRTLFNVGMAAASVTGLPAVLIGSHDPEYVLQHEQLHFAIMQVQALRLSKATAKNPADPYRTRSLHMQVTERANAMHAQLDQDTSGNNASAERLESWVKRMQANMRR